MTGACPGCGKPMTAKCGEQRVHHCAHRGLRNCDSWWEPETLWHRTWKDRFPFTWQEVVQRDGKGERHIADVKTGLGLVLEFQHSHLRPTERAARENFYGNMIWIVDGSRLKRDWPRFSEGRRSLRGSPWRGIYTTAFPAECFPRDWLECRTPVFFDFAGAEPLDRADSIEQRCLWGLLPGRADGHAVVVALPRQQLVHAAHRQPQIVASGKIVHTLAERFRAARVVAFLEARRHQVGRRCRIDRNGTRRTHLLSAAVTICNSIS